MEQIFTGTAYLFLGKIPNGYYACLLQFAAFVNCCTRNYTLVVLKSSRTEYPIHLTLTCWIPGLQGKMAVLLSLLPSVLTVLFKQRYNFKNIKAKF